MRWIKAALKYMLPALLIWCLGHALYLSSALTDDRPPVIYYLEDGMSLAQLKDMKESEDALDDAVPFSSYGRLEHQSFDNPELGRSVTGPALLLFGDSSLIFHSTGELFADDKDGCLLSTEAAWQLFGESYVDRGIVSWQGKEYVNKSISSGISFPFTSIMLTRFLVSFIAENTIRLNSGVNNRYVLSFITFFPSILSDRFLKN